MGESLSELKEKKALLEKAVQAINLKIAIMSSNLEVRLCAACESSCAACQSGCGACNSTKVV